MKFVEQLKSSIDIVKVVGEYVRLKRIGATGRYVGLCPFHQEKTPSFSVNQTCLPSGVAAMFGQNGLSCLTWPTI